MLCAAGGWAGCSLHSAPPVLWHPSQSVLQSESSREGGTALGLPILNRCPELHRRNNSQKSRKCSESHTMSAQVMDLPSPENHQGYSVTPSRDCGSGVLACPSAQPRAQTHRHGHRVGCWHKAQYANSHPQHRRILFLEGSWVLQKPLYLGRRMAGWVEGKSCVKSNPPGLSCAGPGPCTRKGSQSDHWVPHLQKTQIPRDAASWMNLKKMCNDCRNKWESI